MDPFWVKVKLHKNFVTHRSEKSSVYHLLRNPPAKLLTWVLTRFILAQMAKEFKQMRARHSFKIPLLSLRLKNP